MPARLIVFASDFRMYDRTTSDLRRSLRIRQAERYNLGRRVVPGVSVSIAAGGFAGRMQDRLRGLNTAAPTTVVWQQDANRVVIFVSNLQLRAADGCPRLPIIRRRQ
jgi:hypothetical protein